MTRFWPYAENYSKLNDPPIRPWIRWSQNKWYLRFFPSQILQNLVWAFGAEIIRIFCTNWPRVFARGPNSDCSRWVQSLWLHSTRKALIQICGKVWLKDWGRWLRRHQANIEWIGTRRSTIHSIDIECAKRWVRLCFRGVTVHITSKNKLTAFSQIPQFLRNKPIRIHHLF